MSKRIEKADKASALKRSTLGDRAKQRIRDAYSWQFIADRYKEIFVSEEA